MGHIACMEKIKSAYKILSQKPGGQRPLMRPEHMGEHNIKINLKEIVCVRV